MKPTVLVIPAILAVASAAGLLVVSRVGKVSEAFNAQGFEPVHLVTPQMTADAKAMALKDSPRFTVKDSSGQTVSVGSPGIAKPQFVYFIKSDCPCSYAADPLFQALQKQFAGKVDFVGVVDVDSAGAKKWVNEMTPSYPVIPDPKLLMIHAFGAKSSACSVLVNTEGKVDKMWPGFSKDLLLDMNREFAKVTATPERPFDTQYAPVQQAAGCTF